MSDTKILSTDQVRNVFRMGSDISMVQVCESHAAQAQRIEELTAIAKTWQNEYFSMRLRAEVAESQVEALLKALPAERAESIANWGLRCICPDESCCSRCQGIIKALRAYTAAAKSKER